MLSPSKHGAGFFNGLRGSWADEIDKTGVACPRSAKLVNSEYPWQRTAYAAGVETQLSGLAASRNCDGLPRKSWRYLSIVKEVDIERQARRGEQLIEGDAPSDVAFAGCDPRLR